MRPARAHRLQAHCLGGIPGFPIHPSILSHRAGALESLERRMQFEKVAEISVRNFTEKLAARYNSVSDRSIGCPRQLFQTMLL
jgi:hypothetical protein